MAKHQADERDIVEVTWEDCAGSHGWQNAHDIPSPMLIKSVGYVHRDDAVALVITEAITAKNVQVGTTVREYGCASTIPRSQVRAVKILRKGRT
jgi:hypothetical protein